MIISKASDLRFVGEYKDFDGNDLRVEIYKQGNKKAAENLILEGTAPITIEYSQGDEIYKPLKKSICTISVYTDVMLDELYSKSILDTYCIIRKNSEILWWGFLTPCAYNQEYHRVYDSLELEFIDSLSALEYLYYEKREGYVSTYTMEEYIKYILDNVQIGEIDTELLCYFDIEISNGESTTKDIISKTHIIERNFFDEEEDKMSCEEIFEKMFLYYGLTLMQYKQKYILYDVSYTFTKDTPISKRIDINGTNHSNISDTFGCVDDFDFAGDSASFELSKVFGRTAVRANLLVMDNNLPDFDEMLTTYGNRKYKETDLINDGKVIDRIEKYHYDCSSRNINGYAYVGQLKENGLMQVGELTEPIDGRLMKLHRENQFFFFHNNQPKSASFEKYIYTNMYFDNTTYNDTAIALGGTKWFSVSGDDVALKPLPNDAIYYLSIDFDYMFSLWDVPVDESDFDKRYDIEKHNVTSNAHNIITDGSPVPFCYAKIRIGDKYYNGGRISGGSWTTDENSRYLLNIDPQGAQEFRSNNWYSAMDEVKWYMGIKESGNIIPIQYGDAVNGKIEITFYFPYLLSAMIADEMADHANEEPERWSEGFHFIRNLNIKISAQDKLDGSDDKTDLVYIAENKDTNTEEADEKSFYVNTYNPEINTKMSYSYALMEDENNFISYIRTMKRKDSDGKYEEGIPEQLCADRDARYCSAPKIIYSDVLKGNDITPFNSVKFEHFNTEKKMIVGDMTYDLIYNNNNFTLYEL